MNSYIDLVQSRHHRDNASMHVLAYTVRPKNTHRGSTKSMLLKPESGTLRQYFIGPIGVEYLVRGKLRDLLAIDRDLTRSIALNFAYCSLFSFTSFTRCSRSIFRCFCSSSFIVLHSLTSSGFLSLSASRMYFSTDEYRKSAFFSI